MEGEDFIFDEILPGAVSAVKGGHVMGVVKNKRERIESDRNGLGIVGAAIAGEQQEGR